MEEGNKFSAAEIVIGTLFCLFIDILAILIDVTGVGLVIAPFLQAAGNLLTSWWLKMKGNGNAFKMGRQLTKNLVTIIPILPTNTTAFIIETWLHNHPTAVPQKKIIGK